MLDVTPFVKDVAAALRAVLPAEADGFTVYADVEPLKQDDGGKRVILRVDSADELVRGNYTMRLQLLAEVQVPAAAVQQQQGLRAAGAVAGALREVLHYMRGQHGRPYVLLGARVGVPDVVAEEVHFVYSLHAECDVQF